MTGGGSGTGRPVTDGGGEPAGNAGAWPQGHSNPSTVASTPGSFVDLTFRGWVGEGPSAWQPANGLLVHDPASLSQSPGWPATPLICDRSGASSSLEGPPEGGEGPGRKAPWGPRGQGREAETKSRVCAEAAAALPQTRAPLGPGARGSPLVPQLTSGVTCLTPALGLRHRSPWPSSILESCVLNIVAKGVQAHPQNP